MTTEQKFNCIFCKDIFDNKEELQVHFRKHADPQFKSKNRYGGESEVSDEKSKEKAEMVSCDVCSQMFPTISKAITHKHKVHPDHDVKYFCPWCGKLFTMKHPYNNHIQTNHENQDQTEDKIFHCDSCDVDFFQPSAMMYHNRFFHRQDTHIPDVGISKKLRLYNQEVVNLYYCAFCGEEYENKVNLFKHITDDHSDENQSPEEVLRCPLCEAIFYHLDAYEIHLGYHTTEDLYSSQNDLFGDLVDFSLETVPPMIEKVENREEEARDIDAELNAVGIETFLELDMDHTEDSNSGKVKKKKRKKSKKPAITLDEFLSMNQDVFGEDLDFQGVEELPTRVVKKRIKSNKKSANSVASAELEKLKQKGIVVVKVGAKKSTKPAQKKISNKNTSNRELKTSSEVLTKLMNQSNNQIKIVKKSIPSTTSNNALTKMEENAAEQNENEIKLKEKVEKDAEKKIDESEGTFSKPNSSPPNNQNIVSSKIDECPSSLISAYKVPGLVINKNSEIVHTEHDTNSNIPKESSRTSNTPEEVNNSSNDNLEESLKTTHENSPKLKTHTNYLESLNTTLNEQIDQPESDYEESDSETVDRSNVKSVEDNEGSNKYINDEIQSSSDKNRSEPNIRPLVTSLSTLKHLSHLTVKPINTSPECILERVSDTKYNDKSQVKIDKEQTRLTAGTDNETATKPKSIIDKDPALDALKILSKNITIKSLPIATKRNVNESDHEEEADDFKTKTTNNIKLKDISGNQNVTIKKVKVDANEPSPAKKVINMANNVSTNIQSLKSINTGNSSLLETQSSKNNSDDTLNSPSKANANILKHLPNITTKPVLTKKIVQPQVIKQTSKSIKVTEPVHKEQEIIEISDIDDSDNETERCIQQHEPKQDTALSADPLKNLSKHITVKSLNQPTQAVLKNMKVEKTDEKTDDEDSESHAFDSDTDIRSVAKVCSQKLSSKNFALKNALKNLGKSITVKSRTSSPCHSNKSQDHYSQNSNINEADGDLDFHVGKVKITELEDTNINNYDNFEDNFDIENDNNQPIVESPEDSFSENDEVDNDKLLDFESELNTNTVLKSNQEVTANKNTICLNNLKNISKNLTIKSLNSNITDKQEKSKSTLTPENTQNQIVQVATKPTKPLVKEPCNDDASTIRTFKKAANFVDQTSNESLNQKVSVNKEVTVKTFQTKTVIQEITTTVTKTIKTVNQTVKQEMRNSNQMSIPVMPQKVQGMRPSTSKNLQGVVIRQAAPATVRPNNTVTQIRPATTAVRASKQVVLMRSGLSITRPSTPRMPTSKNNLPRSNPNKQVIGKPLKFSPSALASASAKRPNIEDVSGPFSCFKKPKESLIPVLDVPAFAASTGDMVQMKAASQTNTNYMSSSKVIKGNSVLTATQMKSEVSSSMQQLSRLSNTVGIKVKNVQVKQSQVQESETSSKKRTTLEAIEKLQKQGLLVKKPRVEVNDEPDDHVGSYSSADEQDE